MVEAMLEQIYTITGDMLIDKRIWSYGERFLGAAGTPDRALYYRARHVRTRIQIGFENQ